VHPNPFLKIALLVFQNIFAVTLESPGFKTMFAVDSPGKTCNSRSRTLSGVRPVTYTHEHMVFAAIPLITGGKVIPTYPRERIIIAIRTNRIIRRVFFIRAKD
jgi:hypothetical protein